MKVYVLKSWYPNKVYKDQGAWLNDKVTLSERDAEWWIEPPARTWDEEGPDPNSDYDVLDLKCSDFLVDEMVEAKANEWAEELGEADSEERRKQIVRDFTEGFKLAKALYCKEEEEPAKRKFGDIVNEVVVKGFNESKKEESAKHK